MNIERGDKKYRMTRQRRMVLQELCAETCHPSAEELYRRLRRKMPHISLGTVYRNLEVLSSSGQALKLDFGVGPSRFDGTTIPHLHAHCTCCGRAWDVQTQQVPDLKQLICDVQQEGFAVDDYRIQFMGTCSDCQNAKN